MTADADVSQRRRRRRAQPGRMARWLERRGPDGHWVTEPVRGREQLVVGEVDLDRIAEEQLSLDSAGHYNRPDVFTLHLDETPRDQIHYTRSPPVGA